MAVSQNAAFTRDRWGNPRRPLKKFFPVFLCLVLFHGFVFGQDSVDIKVRFLYGSKPKRAFRDAEPKWFGGVLGGHVGIEVDSGKMFDFSYAGKFHYIAQRNNRHSKFHVQTLREFMNTFGGAPMQLKTTTITLPVSRLQKQLLDSIVTAYSASTPYDYAFIGMRCGAATYDVLARLGVLKPYSYRRTYLKIFYPRRLRKRLLRKAEINGWTVSRQEGSGRRKWEKD